MKELTRSSDVDQPSSTPKLPGLRRPLTVGLISAFLYFLIMLRLVSLPATTDIPIVFEIVAIGSTFIGILVAILFNGILTMAGFAIPPLVITLIDLVVSSIPPAYLGWKIASYNKSTRIIGLFLLVVYMILSSIFGFLISRIA